MSRFRSSVRTALSAAMLMAVAPSLTHAGQLQCSNTPVMARGQGFSPSPEQSAEAAMKEWVKKATEIYSDAKWETAKQPDMTCFNQGLYSNCQVVAIPCGTAPTEPKKG